MKRLNAGRQMNALSQRYLKWTAYGLVLLVTAIMQSLPHFLPALGGARPLLLIPVTVCIAMFEGPVGGAAAGVAGGILWDLFSDRLLGSNALLLMILCCACGLLSQLLIRNNFISSSIMTACVLVVHGLADWFFYEVLTQHDEMVYALFHFTLPAIGYSLVLTPLVYFAVYAVSRMLRNRE